VRFKHDTAIPAVGETVEGDVAAALAAEVATIRDLSEQDVRLHPVVPPVRSNTAASSAAFAAALDEADRRRRRLFAAVWAEGRNIGDPVELDRLDAVRRDDVIARRWQHGGNPDQRGRTGGTGPTTTPRWRRQLG
jgi:hypothetical protein